MKRLSRSAFLAFIAFACLVCAVPSVLSPPVPTATPTDQTGRSGIAPSTPVPTFGPSATALPQTRAIRPTATRLAVVGPATNTPRAASPAESATPPARAFNETEYARSLEVGLTAGGRRVESVRVTDGRPAGGERVVMVTYRSAQSTGAGYVEEWLAMFRAISATIRAEGLDVDAVSLVVGTAQGKAGGILTVSAADLLAFEQGNVAPIEFLNRVNAVDLTIPLIEGSPTLKVISPNLNIRAGPGTNYPILDAKNAATFRESDSTAYGPTNGQQVTHIVTNVSRN